MGSIIEVDFDDDAVRKEHLDRVGSVEHFTPKPGWLLVAIYRRPEKTKSGIYLTDKAKDEDNYQGKTGLVLKLGANCFVDDGNYKFHGFKAEVGEWIGFKVSETWALDLNNREGHCRLVEDTDVRALTTRPDKVW